MKHDQPVGESPPEKKRDVQDVMRAEKQRGAARGAVSRQKDRELLQKLSRALEKVTEREFIAALREEFGITETSPQFARILEIWREQH